jgi:hypothetical protein
MASNQVNNAPRTPIAQNTQQLSQIATVPVLAQSNSNIPQRNSFTQQNFQQNFQQNPQNLNHFNQNFQQNFNPHNIAPQNRLKCPLRDDMTEPYQLYPFQPYLQLHRHPLRYWNIACALTTSELSLFFKTLRTQLLFIQRLFEYIRSAPEAAPFIHPVNIDHYPSYQELIKQPIDLSTMYNWFLLGFFNDCTLSVLEYKTIDTQPRSIGVTLFTECIELMKSNSVLFNGSGNTVTKSADAILSQLKETGLRRHPSKPFPLTLAQLYERFLQTPFSQQILQPDPVLVPVQYSSGSTPDDLKR